MGDSSVSCALSGLTLHGEPAVFIPLVKNRYAESLKGARLIGSGSQACFLFSPLTLPYSGELGDYGSFDAIHKDEHTALIESAFGLTIEAFTECCILGQTLKVNDEDVDGAGCFLHPAIFERFSKPVTGGKYAGSLWRGRFAGSKHLETVGCEFVHDRGEAERYRYVYKHPAIEGVSFNCDGEFTHVVEDATGKEGYGYGLDDIHLALKRSGFAGFPVEAVRRARQTSQLQTTYQQELERLMVESNAEGGSNRRLYTLRWRFRYLSLLESIDKNLLGNYLAKMIGGELLDRVESLAYLLWAFTDANRLLMPTITGSQHPEHDTTSVLTRYIADLALTRVREAKV